VVAGLLPKDTCLVFEMPNDNAREIRMRIKAGANGGAANRQFL
jgi:hypothetical protein